MPKHLNGAGTLFGGQLMAWMDEAAATYAMAIMSTQRIVTACFNKLDFLLPAHQGNIVIIECEFIRQGRTSFEVGIVAKKKTSEGFKEICKTSAIFVALDENGKPTPWIRGDWDIAT